MILGRKVLNTFAVMAVVGLGAPMAYRYYLLNLARPRETEAPPSARPAPTVTAAQA